MHFSVASILALSSCFGSIVSGSPSRSLKSPERRARPESHFRLARRGEPETGDDLPDTDTHPNQLDKVETAFNDAIELTSYVKMFIADDTEIFLHYFDEGDRAEITRIFTSINNNDQGNDMLSNILVESTDVNGECGGGTLSYLKNGETGAAESPYIVLCPNAFNKKAVTELNGADPSTPEGTAFYTTCDELGSTVSFHFNTLGMTLLHEYMHYDPMIAASFGAVDDQTNGYGPVNVYDNLDKTLARVNADSYAYYASHVLWTVICGNQYGAPVPGVDDADPDCSDAACGQ